MQDLGTPIRLDIFSGGKIIMCDMQAKEPEYGIQIRNGNGQPVLEVGSHVIRQAPEFATKIGAIAQAEVNLHCLLAMLRHTTPEEVKAHLRKFPTAADAMCGRRK